MANQTVTTDMDMQAVIANGLTHGDTITIKNNAKLTVSQSPTVLMGSILIQVGELFIDGANAVDPIIFTGKDQRAVTVYGGGTLRTSLGWWECPTVGDGTANQTFDVSSYFSGGGVVNKDAFTGVWVETGRRINYTGGSGIPPAVGDWLFKVNDQGVCGRIEAVSGDGVTGYIVVTFLLGAATIADLDSIEIHSLQENNGPDYQISWTATANGADVLEPGVYMEFANANQNNVDYLPTTGIGTASLAFTQAWKSNTLTFGDGTNGLKVPNGAKIRIPKIHVASGTTTTIATNDPSWNTSVQHRYELAVTDGDVFLEGVSLGSAQWADKNCANFTAYYCAANSDFGSDSCPNQTSFKHCIFTGGIFKVQYPTSYQLPNTRNLPKGVIMEDCLGLFHVWSPSYGSMGLRKADHTTMRRIIVSGEKVNFSISGSTDVTIDDIVLTGDIFKMSSAKKVKVTNLKHQGRCDGGLSTKKYIMPMTGGCSEIDVFGIETLNGSHVNQRMFELRDATDIRIVGYHFLERPADQGGTGAYFGYIWDVSTNILFARMFRENGPQHYNLALGAGLMTNIQCINCGSGFDGSIQPKYFNTQFHGLRAGSGPLGSNTGFSLSYPTTAGAHFIDTFHSETEGYFGYRNVPGTPEFPLTVLAGNPIFNRSGRVDVVDGDQWEVDMGYTAKGHKSFTGQITSARNGGSTNFGIWEWGNNVTVEMQYDTGSGWNGTWLDIRTPANLTGIPDFSAGIRFKLRFTATGTATRLEALLIHTNTTHQTQLDNFYPVAQDTVQIKITAVDAETLIPVPGARVRAVADVGGPAAPGVEIVSGVTAASGSIIVPSYLFQGNQPIKGVVRRGTNPPYYKEGKIIGSITSAGFTTTVPLVRDD